MSRASFAVVGLVFTSMGCSSTSSEGRSSSAVRGGPDGGRGDSGPPSVHQIADGGPVADAGGDTAGGASGVGGAAGGTGGVAGAAGSGGHAGAAGAGGGPTGACDGLGSSACSDRADCTPLTKNDYCPCADIGDPSCACEDGLYVGCTARSIMADGQLEGVWLIGWSGGLDHYSWVRFDRDGSARILADAGPDSWAPYWHCSGSAASWAWAETPETVLLTLPEGCRGAPRIESLTFTGFRAAGGRAAWAFPKAAVLEGLLAGNHGIHAWKFPPSWCDVAMTTCGDPYRL